MAEVASVEVPGWHRPLGVGLALLSSVFVGTSFIFKKKGLVQMQALGHKPGEGHAYLTSGMWWAGMILMSLGEILNVVAYAFSPAILITPLGALSVVISAVLSSFFLDERLSISAKIGCAQCLLGSIIIVLNASGENPVDTLANFYSQVFHTAFITYTIVVGVIVLLLIYWVAPVYGHRTPAIYITICSLFGSYLVLSTQGVGAAIVHSFANWETDNQFKQWSLYPLIIMIAITVCFQLHFLNKALNIFSTAVVTPVYYVFFSTATLISTAVLFRGFPVDTMLAGVYVVVGFLIICGGVILLFLYSVRATKLDDAKKQLITLSPTTAVNGTIPDLPHAHDLDDEDDVDQIIDSAFARRGLTRPSGSSPNVLERENSRPLKFLPDLEKLVNSSTNLWRNISSKIGNGSRNRSLPEIVPMTGVAIEDTSGSDLALHSEMTEFIRGSERGGTSPRFGGNRASRDTPKVNRISSEFDQRGSTASYQIGDPASSTQHLFGEEVKVYSSPSNPAEMRSRTSNSLANRPSGDLADGLSTRSGRTGGRSVSDRPPPRPTVSQQPQWVAFGSDSHYRSQSAGASNDMDVAVPILPPPPKTMGSSVVIRIGPQV